MKFNGSPTQFEFAIKALCESMGFTVELTQPSHDGGVDHFVIDPAPIRGGRYIIQAKRYEGGVGEPVIRDLYGTLLHSGAVKAILITTGYFTEAAEAFAKGKPIELVNGDALEKLVQQFQLHDEFFGNSMPLRSPELSHVVSADEMLEQYRTNPTDSLVPRIFALLLDDENRHEEAMSFGLAHEEQLLYSPLWFSCYLYCLAIRERTSELSSALGLLIRIRSELVPIVVADSVSETHGEEAIQSSRNYLRQALQAAALATESDPSKCRAFAQAYLLLGDRSESSRWLDKALQLAPEDFECLCLLAAYQTASGKHREALDKLKRCLLSEPFSTVAIFNYQSAKQGLLSAVLKLTANDGGESYAIIFSISESSISFLKEPPKVSDEDCRTILEEILRYDPSNSKVREALLQFLPLEERIALGEELAYQISEVTGVAKILQSAYLYRATHNDPSPGARRQDIKRGIQWTRSLYDAGVRDVDILVAGAVLMNISDEKGKSVVEFLQNHTDLMPSIGRLRRIFCQNLTPPDAIAFLEQLLSEKRRDYSESELMEIHHEMGSYYREIGDHERALVEYRYCANFEDKADLISYLFLVREMKGNAASYQEALRLLDEHGETLATLCGLAQECEANDLWSDEIKHLRKAHTLAPSDSEICSGLAFAYSMLEQGTEAAHWNRKTALLSEI